MPLKYFLPLYLCAYVCAAFGWRSFQVWQKTGVNPVVFRSADNAHDFIGRVFELLFALIVTVVLAYSFFPEIYLYSNPIEWLARAWLKSLGVVLLLASLVWTVLAQAQMGSSWRIGIDQEHRTPLVRRGVFRFSRNPIFLGMILTLLGLFLAIPNALTLLTWALGVVLIQIQVRLEEDFLGRIHGADYTRYRQEVRRWI